MLASFDKPTTQKRRIAESHPDQAARQQKMLLVARQQLALAKTIFVMDDRHHVEAVQPIIRGWQALAASRASGLGGPLPEPATVPSLVEDTYLRGLSQKDREKWTLSYKKLNESFASTPWHEASIEAVGREDLSFQLATLDRACSSGRRRLNPFALPPGLTKKKLGLVLCSFILSLGFLSPLICSLTKKRPERPITRSPQEEVFMPLSQLVVPKPEGTSWDDAENVLFYKKLVVSLGRVVRFSRLQVSLDNNDRYTLAFHRGSRTIATLQLGPYERGFGLHIYDVKSPPEVVHAGADAILIRPLNGDSCYALGHLTLLGLSTAPQ